MKLEELSLLSSSDPQHGGMLDAGSPRGTLVWTPLQLACALGDEELVSSLLAGAKHSVLDTGKTKYGYSPLHVAVHFGHVAIVKQLLSHATSSEVAAMDSQIGATALHLAVLSGNLELVRVLLEAGAKHAPTKNGTTPLDVAKELGHSEITQVFVDHVQKESGKEQIGNWLASIGMVEYAPHFHDAGFDDAAFLLANGLSEAALDAMKIEKPGHRMKLQSLYQLRESIPDLSGEEEEDDEDEDEDSESDENSSGSGDEEDNESEDESGSASGSE